MTKLTWCVIGFGLLAICAESRAGLITYSTRASWTAAAGPASGGENFNGFLVDTTIQNTSVAISNGTVSGEPGVNGGATNKIDVAPFQFDGYYEIDQTAYLLGDLVNGQQITFDLTSPVTAWGADFRGVADGGRPTKLEVYSAANALLGVIDLASDGTNQELQFYGFTVVNDQAARVVLINSGGDNDVFSVDNIEYVQSNGVVPEPSALVSGGLGALLLVGLALRRGADSCRR